MKQRIILVILDGWGLKDREYGNAIKQAKTPNFSKFWLKYPHAVLQASGEAVGLPDGQIGTSEVGHMTIGAGRVIFQDLVRINKSISDGSFFQNKAIVSALEHVKKHNSTLHIKGLFSPGGVHSHQDHVMAMIKAAKLYGISKVFIHVFTDGRDTLPKSAFSYISELEKFINKQGVGKIASISGRYYAMDRDQNWDRTDRAFNLLVKGKGRKYKTTRSAIEDSYQKGANDEFIEPCRIEVGKGEEGIISSNDALVFINFRNDRARQLVERFLNHGPKNLHYVTMTRYHPDYQVEVAYPPQMLINCLGEVISKKSLRQLRITETEKFAHLTFFLNCKKESAFEGEDRIMFDSYSDIKTHDERPQMRTPDIIKQIVRNMEEKTYPAIFTNLCNCDMLGHTGNLKATVEAVETVDKAIGILADEAKKNDYQVVITADHGNAEEMIDENTKSKLTSHTLNPVPFILIGKYQKLNRDRGSLIDIAPTILKLFKINQPYEMTGTSFI